MIEINASDFIHGYREALKSVALMLIMSDKSNRADGALDALELLDTMLVEYGVTNEPA